MEARRARLRAYGDLFAAGGERDAEAEARVDLALLAAERGAIAEALAALRRSLQLRWSGADDAERGQGLLLLATLLLRAERLAVAGRCVRLAESHLRRTPDQAALSACWFVEALLARAAGDLDRAERLLHRARDGFVAHGRAANAAHTLLELGDLLASTGRAEAALLCFETAVEFYRQARQPLAAGRAARMAGELVAVAGEAPSASAEWYARAADHEREAERPDLAAASDLEAALGWLDAGDSIRARQTLGRVAPEALADHGVLAARLLRRLAESEFAGGVGGEGLRLLERAVPPALAARDEEELAALLDLWVGRLVEGALPPTGWARLSTLAGQLDEAGLPSLAALCRDAVASLK